MSPCRTRHAPTAIAAAAPRPVPRSVKNRVSKPSASTQNVLSDSARAFAASFAPNALLCPNAFSVGRPCTASRNSSPNALNAAERASAARWSARCTSCGSASVTSAATSRIAAVGTSHHASTAKIMIGAHAAITSCGR